MSKHDSKERAVVVTKAYDFVVWLLPTVQHFQRSYRHTLGDRLIGAGVELLMTLVQCAYAAEKGALLREASLQANCLRYLLRLAKDVHLMTVDSYGFSAGRIEEVGRMIGGWQRSVERRA